MVAQCFNLTGLQARLVHTAGCWFIYQERKVLGSPRSDAASHQHFKSPIRTPSSPHVTPHSTLFSPDHFIPHYYFSTLRYLHSSTMSINNIPDAFDEYFKQPPHSWNIQTFLQRAVDNASLQGHRYNQDLTHQAWNRNIRTLIHDIDPQRSKRAGELLRKWSAKVRICPPRILFENISSENISCLVYTYRAHTHYACSHMAYVVHDYSLYGLCGSSILLYGGCVEHCLPPVRQRASGVSGLCRLLTLYFSQRVTSLIRHSQNDFTPLHSRLAPKAKSSLIAPK